MARSPDHMIRASLPQQVAARIQQAVIDGGLPTGDRLGSEREMAETYAVSRAVVREALRVLAARGVIVVHQGRGAFVREAAIDSHDNPIDVMLRRRSAERPIWELYEVRLMLEVELAGLAAQRATSEQVADMRLAIEGTIASADDENAFVRHDLTFHAAITAAAGNDLFRLLQEPIDGLLAEFRQIAFRRDREATVASAELDHSEILRAVEERDSLKARDAMRRHVEAARWVYGLPLSDRIAPPPTDL